MTQIDWLNETAPSTEAWLSLAVDPLALPGDPDLSGVTGQTHATDYDALRFTCMKGSGRVWACDGKYVACRPDGFHDATRSRHQRFLRSGHYKHIGTFDDVQIFELMPQSPFYRKPISLDEATHYETIRGCAIAAVNRDWVMYHDLLDQIAKRCKSLPTGTESGAVENVVATERWTFILEQIGQMIYMRNGPTQAEVDAGLRSVRQRRGHKVSSNIALPERARILQ